jgi:hypothetical protein
MDNIKNKVNLFEVISLRGPQTAFHSEFTLRSTIIDLHPYQMVGDNLVMKLVMAGFSTFRESLSFPHRISIRILACSIAISTSFMMIPKTLEDLNLPTSFSNSQLFLNVD